MSSLPFLTSFSSLRRWVVSPSLHLPTHTHPPTSRCHCRCLKTHKVWVRREVSWRSKWRSDRWQEKKITPTRVCVCVRQKIMKFGLWDAILSSNHEMGQCFVIACHNLAWHSNFQISCVYYVFNILERTSFPFFLALQIWDLPFPKYVTSRSHTVRWFNSYDVRDRSNCPSVCYALSAAFNDSVLSRCVVGTGSILAGEMFGDWCGLGDRVCPFFFE